jgi:hypothetical protein
MKWLVGILLFLILPTSEVAAQEVGALVARSVSSLSASSPAAEPRPTPQVIRDDAVKDTWELGLGFTVVRFGSSAFDSTMSGLDTTVSYYVRDHVAVEGSITSTFGSSSSRTGASRYVFYGTGVKLSAGNRKLQPFAHVLIGGVHVFPQTAFGNNGFGLQLGGGVERKLKQRLWLRVEADYVRSQVHSAGQNNFQGGAGISYPF